VCARVGPAADGGGKGDDESREKRVPGRATADTIDRPGSASQSGLINLVCVCGAALRMLSSALWDFGSVLVVIPHAVCRPTQRLVASASIRLFFIYLNSLSLCAWRSHQDLRGANMAAGE